MIRCIDIRLLLVTWLVLLVTGCSRDYEPVQEPAMSDKSAFMMYIYLPNGGTTRNGEDDRSIYIDQPFERKIKSFRVWVFARNSLHELMSISDADGATNKVLYRTVGSIDESVNMLTEVFDVLDGINNTYPYVDIYVIVNSESLGKDEDWCRPKETESLQEMESRLENLLLDTSSFGIGENMVSAASEDGLPMSGYLKNAPVSAQGVVFTTMGIKVKRAVSKIRFVFAKSPSTPEASITSVKLNTGMIPTTEYLFSGTAAVNNVALHETGYGNEYYGEITFFNSDAPATINTNVMPTILSWSASLNRQEWEDALNAAIANNEATELVRAYLHESPQRLTGTITYKLTTDGAEESATFQMSESPTGQFLRNHSWTVYAFFTEGGLIYEVANWDEETVTVKPVI